MSSRVQMIREIRENYRLNSPRVFQAMLQVPREKFIPPNKQHLAYQDTPVSIGFGQTVSQPYTVAFMTHLLIEKLKAKNKVLEIGTGSGYQAAVLSKIFKKVYTVEIVPELADKAAKILHKLKYDSVFVRQGSGQWGWPEECFDAIIVTAAVKRKFLQILFDQLKNGGVLVAPLKQIEGAEMTRYIKLTQGTNIKLKSERFGTFYFVPFVEEKN